MALVKMMMARSGRYAIMARSDAQSPWVQIESILGAELAQRYVDDMENDDDARKENCREAAEDSDWGDDAPEKF